MSSTYTFENSPTMLPVSNGILLLGEHVKFIKGTPDTTNFAPTRYVPFNPRNLMQKKVLELYRNLFPDNEPDSHEFFMMLHAASLTASDTNPMFCIKYGGGRNGKTLTTEIHRRMMGQFATTLPIEFITGKQQRGAETESPLSIENARYVTFQEPEKSEALSSSKIRLLIGGGAISCRQNYGEQHMISMPRCNYVLDTNFCPKITNNNLKVWQRIKVIKMDMRFHTADMMNNYDPTNPFHRVAVNTREFINDPEYLSAYLAVLVFYYEQLQTKYDGNVFNLPHPNIENQTEEYRNCQNKLNLFYNKYLVNCNATEQNTKLLVNDIKEKYCQYYSMDGVLTNEFKENIDSNIKNSKIASLIHQDNVGRDYIIGYRLLEHNGEDELKEGEICFGSPYARFTQKNNIQPETWNQYYERICRIYDAKVM